MNYSKKYFINKMHYLKTSDKKTLPIQKLIYFTAGFITISMNVKIDTKEKFSVLTPKESDITANMTDQLIEMLHAYLDKDLPHIILNMKYVNNIDIETAEKISDLQLQFYEKNASFIVCELQNSLEIIFKEMDLFDTMNVTPTESEAWDIVQMEEIERELMRDFDNSTD